MPNKNNLIRPPTTHNRIDRITNRPGAQERITTIRQRMREDDRIYAENLAAIRRAAELTQADLAQRMGTAQSEISKIERRDDILLSTLATYLEQIGDSPRVVVTVNGIDIELDLTKATE